MSSEHLAAVLAQQGGPFIVQPQPTLEPGPGEMLIEPHAIAVNPVDQAQRDLGFPPVPSYPTVIGADISGTVIKAGPDVPSSAPKPGTRVTALASNFYKGGLAQYGAFQKRVLVRYEGVVPLPESISFEEGAIFPLAVLTALSAFTTIGIELDAKFAPEDKKAILIWGGASSVGTITIQFAKHLGLIIYTTASTKHHEYLKSLGAHRTFDYKDADVVSQIVAAVKEDGVTLTDAHLVAPGSLQSVLDVLKETKGDSRARVGHAPPLFPEAPSLEGVEVIFVLPPLEDSARNAHIEKAFQGWLKPSLEAGNVVPSPCVQVVEGGLDGLNEALDILGKGVSATKIVVSV
ncbi:chaperonin 10-like protein [Aspergillus pseudoustus]|uniref:Chaperonin 10-like protein n=1 Tax=Aspergillus pseudoustus TaxID=1810923 RepID=A0ABR4KH87_9EURO